MMPSLNHLLNDVCHRRIASMCSCENADRTKYHHAAVFFRSGAPPPLLKVHGLW